MVGHRVTEAEVRHHRAHDRIVRQQATLFHVERVDTEHLIAVHDRAVLVDCDQTIGVAVVRDADVRAVGLDRLLQELGVRRTDMVVDIGSVWICGDHVHLCSGEAIHLGRNVARCTVRAIDDHAQAG